MNITVIPISYMQAIEKGNKAKLNFAKEYQNDASIVPLAPISRTQR